MPPTYQLSLLLGGVERAYGRLDETQLVEDLTITDLLNEAPNTARFTVKGFTPTVGMEMTFEITYAATVYRLFAGYVTPLEQHYVGTPSLPEWSVSATDYTIGLNSLKVLKRYTNQSASDIAADIITNFAPAYYTVTNIEAGLPVVDEISFTNTDVTAALTQLAKRIGANWYCDYYKDVHFFFEDTGVAPDPLIDTHPSLIGFSSTQDLSQVVNRIWSEGGGSNALEECGTSEDIIPVHTATWYPNVADYWVTSGPQRMAYDSVHDGDTGTLVGNGTGPSSAPILTPSDSATGVEAGLHAYAITFVTVAGESLTSPLARITVGSIAAPGLCTSYTVLTGGSITAGTHTYKVTFVSSIGETEGGTTSGVQTIGTVPITDPIYQVADGGAVAYGDVTNGTYSWQFTFVDASGQTLPNPVATGYILAPGRIIQRNNAAPAGAVYWNLYRTTNGGATLLRTMSNIPVGTAQIDDMTADAFLGAPGPRSKPIYLATQAGAGALGAGTYSWAYTITTAAGETLPSPLITGPVNANDRIQFLLPAIFDPGLMAVAVTWNLYRTVVGGAQLKLAAGGLAMSTTTQYDGLADGSLGANAPTVDTSGIPTPGALPVANTTGVQGSVALAGLPIGPTGTTARNIYRTAAGGAQHKYVTQIANNTATSYTDTMADGSLGANVPTSNTAIQRHIDLSSVPTGPPAVVSRNVYRTEAAGSQLKLVANIADNTTTTYHDTTIDASLGANAPTGDLSGLTADLLTASFKTTGTTFSTNGAATNATTASPSFTSASYTFVAADVGASVYIKSGTNWIVGFYSIVSVAAGAATLNKACASVASPTGATWGVDYSLVSSPRYSFSDLVIDASTSTKFTSAAYPVGVNFIGNSVSITDGLGFTRQQVIVLSISGVIATCDKSLGVLSSTGGIAVLGGVTRRNVLPGETEIPVAGTAPFPSTGGWVVIGNGSQVIRYTGITASILTGIPVSGIGAIVAAVSYGTTITSAPHIHLTEAIQYPILRGDQVNVLTMVEDAASQAVLAALFGGNGVREDIIQDGRLSALEALARGGARLALRKDVELLVGYTSRDLLTTSGKLVEVNLPAPTNVSAILRIQQVTISNFFPEIAPTFSVSASSIRYTFEDLLRETVTGNATRPL